MSGAELQAEFVSCKYGMVSLKKDDGTIVKIRLSALSPESQAIIKQLSPDLPSKSNSGSSAAAASPKAGGTSANPELKLKDKCNILVYEHANFDASFKSTSALEIQLKDNGEPVGEPLHFGYKLILDKDIIESTSKRNRRGRLTNAAYTKKDPLEIVLKKVLEKNNGEKVEFEHTFAFEGNSITFSQQILNNKMHSLGCHIAFPKSHDFPFDTPLSEILKIANQCTIAIKPIEGKGKKEVLKYGVAVNLNRVISESFTQGPWGSRKLTITGEKTECSYLAIKNYSKAPLYEKYSYHYPSMAKGKEPVKSGKLTITIE